MCYRQLAVYIGKKKTGGQTRAAPSGHRIYIQMPDSRLIYHTPTRTLDLPPPTCFGAPAKFDRWRDLQCTAIMSAVDSPKRFVMQAAPTGFGKSLVYVGQALVTGARTCILTSTKGLQSQLIGDFQESGLVDIRGMNSYSCRAAESEFGIIQTQERATSCEEGPCRAGLKCSIRDMGCGYYDAYHQAQRAQLVVTNYTYWMTIHRYGEGLGNFDLLVLDEGHNAPDELSDFLAIELDTFEIETVVRSQPLPDGCHVDDWRKWAVHHSSLMASKLDELQQRLKDQKEGGGRLDHSLVRSISHLRRVLSKVKSLAGMRGEWVYERNGRKWRFDPVWPREYAESVLFRGTPKVVIFSATIRPKTASILGIDPGALQFNEYPSSFPVSRRPVVHVPTCQMNHRTSPDNLGKWVTRIDQIIGQRLDRKGIIHTVSFDRRNFIIQRSEYSEIMVANDSSNTRAAVERFKQMPAPAVFVSPSLTTGWDFPHDDARYIIVGKIPFPDNRPTVIQARLKSDRDYTNYIAAQNLVQMTGRGMRAEDDLCESIIIDDNIVWFARQAKHYFPGWWLESFQLGRTIPRPPALGFGT